MVCVWWGGRGFILGEEELLQMVIDFVFVVVLQIVVDFVFVVVLQMVIDLGFVVDVYVICFYFFCGRLPPLPKWKGGAVVGSSVLHVFRDTFYEGTEGVLVDEFAGGAAVGLVGLVNAMHLAVGMVVLPVLG
jgi:hypothetical protein